MALLQKIPLKTSTTDQLVTVELGGNPFILRVLWNERFGYYTLSISTLADVVLLENVKMVKNYPLIGRYKDTRLPFGDFYFVQEKAGFDRPGYDDLAVYFNLYYYEADVVAATAVVEQTTTIPPVGTSWDRLLTSWDSGSTLWDQ